MTVALAYADAAPMGTAPVLGIRDVLATMPSGAIDATPLSDAELAKYLQTHCNRQCDRDREKAHILRDALAHDGGIEQMRAKVDEVFESLDVRARVKRMLPIARFSNPTKRITGEIATVYAEPASRSVGGGDANAAKYDDLCESMAIDEQMDTVCGMLNLHYALFVAPRVEDGDEGPEVVLDVASAATARPVMHPNRNTRIVGVLTRCEFRTVRGRHSKPAAWLLTTAAEYEYLDDDFMPVTNGDGSSTRVVHDLGFMPWIPLSTAMNVPDFWPGEDGEGLTAAHVTGWIVEALMVNETRTATKQPVIQGDTSTMARGQSVESSAFLEAPEGTSITSIEWGTDPTIFMGAADHALERAGCDVGLSLTELKRQGVQSAEARELMLAPIRERRRRQVKKFRRFERRLAYVLSVVLAKHAPDLAFKFEDWRIDFGEPQVLLSKKERLEIFNIEKPAGLDSTFKFYARENPDITDDQARSDVLDNLVDETIRIVAMRLMQSLSGGPATAIDGSPGPKGNQFSASQDGKPASLPGTESPTATGAIDGDAGPPGEETT